VRPVKILGTGWCRLGRRADLFGGQERKTATALPNTRYLLHEPRGGVGGQATDVEIQAREIIKMRERLNRIFAEATGKSLEQIKKDTDRDFWMSAEQALAYGLVGKIVTTHAEIL
jgi:ATP-dependent Clp protease protease subunit